MFGQCKSLNLETVAEAGTLHVCPVFIVLPGHLHLDTIKQTSRSARTLVWANYSHSYVFCKTTLVYTTRGLCSHFPAVFTLMS